MKRSNGCRLNRCLTRTTEIQHNGTRPRENTPELRSRFPRVVVASTIHYLPPMTKLQHLEKILNGYGSVLIGYSGGVDSVFLAAAAVDVLGKENVLAVTGRS